MSKLRDLGDQTYRQTWSVLVFYGHKIIIFITPNKMGYMDNNWFKVGNKYCSSLISHEITSI